MKLYKIYTYIFIISTQWIMGQEYGNKIDSVIHNSSAEIRGKISENNGIYALFFYDKYEKDSHAKILQDKGFHGGGPSWLGILYTAFNIYEENLLDHINYNIDVSGIRFQSKNEEDIKMIGKVIALVKSDQKIMNELISDAQKLEIMK